MTVCGGLLILAVELSFIVLQCKRVQTTVQCARNFGVILNTLQGGVTPPPPKLYPTRSEGDVEKTFRDNDNSASLLEPLCVKLNNCYQYN